MTGGTDVEPGPSMLSPRKLAPTSATRSTDESSTQCPSNLRILICTGNLGNAAPTKESFAAWLPKDGSVDEVLKNAKYPSPEGYEPPGEQDHGGKFDLIVVGMQEAVFSVKDKKVSVSDEKLSTIAEGSEREGGVSKMNLTLANLKMASMKGLLPRRGSQDSLLSDDSAMSLVQDETKIKAKLFDTDGGAGGAGAGGESNSDDLDIKGGSPTSSEKAKLSSRDGPMPGKRKPSPKSGVTPTKAAKATVQLVTDTADGIATATKETIINPIATGIVSVAGNADHTKGGTVGGKDFGGKTVFGVTTLVAGAKPEEWVGGTRELYEMGDAQVGQGNYEAIVRYQRGEMRLVVLVRKELAPLVTNVETLAENTGIGGVVANKGGIITTLTLGGITRLSFLTAHLEAHEGKEHYINRCSNLAEILSGAKKGSLDASITSHHMFAMGDLNFRVALPPPEGKEKWDGTEHRSKVRSMVEAEDWTALNEADELRGALAKGDCLNGFQTLPCNFHPTFKVHRELAFNYQEKRTPSYTDRILWKSAHGLKDDVRPLLYEPVADYATSDHKPVRGVYSVAIRGHGSLQRPGDRRAQLATQISSKGRNLHIFVSDMQCKDLSRVWEGRQNAPYILFVSDPPDLVQTKRSTKQRVLDNLGLGGFEQHFSKSVSTKIRNGYVRTRVHKNNGKNPNWGEVEIHLKIQKLGIEGPQDLAGSFLYLDVYDQQGFSANEDDYLIGTVALNLQNLADEREEDEDDSDIGGRTGGSIFRSIKHKTSMPIFDMIEIDEPILKNGKEKGRLICSISSWWLSPDREGGHLSQRRSTRNIKQKKEKWPSKWPFVKKK